jgi:hypothetical protein
MRKYKILLVALPFLLMACSKGGDSPAPVTPPVVIVPEVDIAFKVEIPVGTDIVDYSKIYGAIGGAQEINVNVTSTLPKDGVTIDVKVTKDSDNSSVFNKNISSTTAATNTIAINSLSPGVLSTATVVVTSKSKSTNTATKTFKIAAKS